MAEEQQELSLRFFKSVHPGRTLTPHTRKGKERKSLSPRRSVQASEALKLQAPSPLFTLSVSKNADSEDSDVDDVLSKLQKILKKKKNGSRRIQKKEKKEKEPVCYECRKSGHLRPDCPRLKKTGQPEKSKKQHKKFKRKAMAAAWKNEETTSSESSSPESEKEQVESLIQGEHRLRGSYSFMSIIVEPLNDLIDHKLSEEREHEQRLELQRISSTDLFKAAHIKDEAWLKNNKSFSEDFSRVYIREEPQLHIHSKEKRERARAQEEVFKHLKPSSFKLLLLSSLSLCASL
ncbi:hypothetical protein Taro_006326 [Colocasia esculenta]|uniref:CCHC-type domain-containing protein n=1 Tax=Colocasia esculenta TaxID=4460 RepID=A0A843TX48_COLES|nr:hypothetical protein [Colocasia esculenta]